MSSTDAAPVISTEGDGKEETKESNSSENDTSNVDQANKSMKKVKSKKDLKTDPSRFDLPGVNFNGKLIGIDDVTNARGDKMCQESMYRLKMAVKQSGQHKQKIIINVSLDGIRIIDIRTQATNHTHAVHRISFISRDITDNRAFGYVYGVGEGKHKFYAIKTEKAAEALVLTLRDLFQCVYEMKKKEVEEAKHKVEEPDPATEAKEEGEPVYQVPQNGKPVENGETTYEVPPNNNPVQDEAPDLLNLENELESMERRIEQIDTMEELFKELEAPPPASTKAPSSSTASSWANDLAGLSQAQTTPTFSMGGAPFSAGSQPFGAAPGQFGAPRQPFGQPAPFGGQPSQQPFGAAGQPGFPGGFPQQQPTSGGFGAQPNPFGAPPGVPPRTGMGFGANPGNPFPGTPFPNNAPPNFQMGSAAPAPVSDPFGNDPFATESSDFGEGLLTPARSEVPKDEVTGNKTEPKDAFSDLVNIGGKSKPNKNPKELFQDLASPERKSLNQLKVDKPGTPKSTSPVQASDEFPDSFDTQAFMDPSASSMPFTTADPFASDPFATAQPSTAQPSNEQDSFFNTNVSGGSDDEDPYNIPLPQGPPPPLPQDIASVSDPLGGPPPPPRPSINLPTSTPPLPQIPPRPKSASSDSFKSSSTSLNSVSDSQTVNQESTPPLPPRPRVDCSVVPVPRPRPRASIPQSDKLFVNNNNKSDKTMHSVNANSVISDKQDDCVQNFDTQHTNDQSPVNISQQKSAKVERLESSESQKSVFTSSSNGHRSSSVIADPFVSTDPFATEDPFTQSDPFANDPFSPDPFSDISDSKSEKKEDPFLTVVSSPRSADVADPFSVFDKKILNESFKFEKTSSAKKGKAKISGQ